MSFLQAVFLVVFWVAIIIAAVTVFVLVTNFLYSVSPWLPAASLLMFFMCLAVGMLMGSNH